MSANDAPRTHREIFFDSDRRVGKGIATYGELDESTFEGLETIDDVSDDPDAMDILVDDGRVYVELSRSVVAMESQAAAEVAMDRVAASETARTAVRDSAPAVEAVASVNMATGKFAAGEAGLDPTDFADMDAVAASETAMDAVVASETAMDAVAASETAMDAVAASETAMDAVTGSTLATSIGLLSPHFDIIFSEQVGSETFFDGRTINPNSGDVEGIPYVYSWDGGNANAEIVFSNNTPSEFDGGRSLHIDSETSTTGDTFANSDESHSDYLLDVSDADNFSVWLNDPDENEFCIFVDGTKVASGLTPSSWEKHTFGVSGETGEIIIGVGSNNDTTGGEWYFTAPHLEN